MTDDKTRTENDWTHPGAYRSFLVRCWQEPDAGNGKPAWRFTLVQLGEERPQHGFACLTDLAAFVHRELELP